MNLKILTQQFSQLEIYTPKRFISSKVLLFSIKNFFLFNFNSVHIFDYSSLTATKDLEEYRLVGHCTLLFLQTCCLR